MSQASNALLFEDWEIPEEIVTPPLPVSPPAPLLGIVPARPKEVEPEFETLDLGRGMVSPRLNRATGELRIPLNVSPRFRYWREGGQSIFRTLIEFNAPLASWRRYAQECPEVLRPAHLQQKACKPHLHWYPSFLCCAECGWWDECSEEQYQTLEVSNE